MKRRLCLCLVIVAAVMMRAAGGPVNAAVAFVDVTVIPMDSDRTLPRHTVIVRGDRIVQLGPSAQMKPPADAQRIDGTGKFLIPGLGEMHGHNPPPGSTREYIENVFFLFVANGVTTVRSMLGFPGQLELREEATRGEFVAPTLLLAGPSFSGQSVTSPQSAIERVRAQKAEGWDLLKVHPGVKREVYDAMAATAKEVGMEFSGHIPADVGLVHAIERGQRTIDHLDGYIEHLKADAGPLDRAKLAEIVSLTRGAGAWVVPTMVLWETIIGAADSEELEGFSELKYMPGTEVERWRTSYQRRVSAPEFNRGRARQIAENRTVLLKALHEGGVKIIFGTDAPQIYSVPGFSIHREMRAMAGAGMSNFAVLSSATKAVGEYLQRTDRFGTIAPGHRADLILLDANPLADLGNVARRSGVMVRGRWLSESDLQARLAKVAAEVAK